MRSSTPLPAVASPSPGARDRGLDRVRAVAVLAMVVGHTLAAVMTDQARESAGMLAYRSMRAVTAPLFLFVAGWAFAATVQRTGARGPEVLRRYLPRVALLLGWGYFLRWPGWDVPALLAGERSVWAHLLAFDALHGVAGALLVGAGALAAVRGPWARMALLAALTLGYPLVSPAVRAAMDSGRWPLVLEQALAGRTSSFPLFPWAAYFFAGGFTGLALGRVTRVRPWLCLLVTGTLVLSAMSLWGGDPKQGDLTLVAWRLGLLLVAAGLVMALPAGLDGVLAPVGRASLWAYVVHLPMAYGWSTFPGLAERVGPSLELLPALGVALGVLAVSLALSLPAQHLYTRWRARGRERAGRDAPPARLEKREVEAPPGSQPG